MLMDQCYVAVLGCQTSYLSGTYSSPFPQSGWVSLENIFSGHPTLPLQSPLRSLILVGINQHLFAQITHPNITSKPWIGNMKDQKINYT